MLVLVRDFFQGAVHQLELISNGGTFASRANVRWVAISLTENHACLTCQSHMAAYCLPDGPMRATCQYITGYKMGP